jgi:hypothetical protein
MYKTHVKAVNRIQNCDALWTAYIDALDGHRFLIKGNIRSEKSHRSWMQALKNRSLELDPENDMGIR